MADFLPVDFDWSLSGYLDKLKTAALEFSSVFSEFIGNEAKARASGYGDEFDNIRANAENVKNTIEWINSQVDAASSWLGKVFGMGGISETGIGAIPLIPVAYVTAALAALTYAVDNMTRFNRKMALVQSGDAPSSILTDSPTIIGEASGLLKWAIIGAVIYFALPKILKRMK